MKLSKSKFDNLYNEAAMIHEQLSEIVFDEKRGHAGTEVELALTTAEADIASAMGTS